MPYDDDAKRPIYLAATAMSSKIKPLRAIMGMALLLPVFGFDCAAAKQQKGAKLVTPDDSAVVQDAEKPISQWLETMRLADVQGYVEIKEFSELQDGARVLQNSEYWLEKFLRAEANPYLQKPVRHSVHHATPKTFDVLRHKYDAAGKHLVVDETVNLILITVEQSVEEFLTGGESAKQDEINKISALLLKMTGTMIAPNLREAPYQWVFRFSDTIRDGTRFSSNPKENPRRMWSWASRVDGGIYKNRLYFLCLKKGESSSGKIISPDGQHWFDGKSWNDAPDR